MIHQSHWHSIWTTVVDWTGKAISLFTSSKLGTTDRQKPLLNRRERRTIQKALRRYRKFNHDTSRAHKKEDPVPSHCYQTA